VTPFLTIPVILFCQIKSTMDRSLSLNFCMATVSNLNFHFRVWRHNACINVLENNILAQNNACLNNVYENEILVAVEKSFVMGAFMSNV